MDLRDDLDECLSNMLVELRYSNGDEKERSSMVDDFCKLYRVRLEEKKLDDEYTRETLDSLKEISDEKKDHWAVIIGRATDIGIALLKVGATVAGYCLCAKMHADSIAADSYGVLQRSKSFSIIPKVDPARDL